MKIIEATATLHGEKYHASLMIKTKKVVRIPSPILLNSIASELRAGNEVRLVYSDTDEEAAVRFYPMATTDWKVHAVAQTLNPFRASVFEGAKLRATTRGGKPYSERQYAQARQNENAHDRAVRAVPKRVITCPKCGTDIALSGLFNN